MKQHLLILTVCGMWLTGCNSTAEDTHQVKIHPTDEHGRLIMTQQQVKHATKEGNMVFIDGGGRGEYLTLQEYDIALRKPNALMSLGGHNAQDGKVSSLIKVGSLKLNLERVAAENGWGRVFYEGNDMYVSQPVVYEGNNLEDVYLAIIKDYPLLMCMDEFDLSVTFIRDTLDIPSSVKPLQLKRQGPPPLNDTMPDY